MVEFALIVPLFILMSQLGWTGKLIAVIVPGLVTAFGVFWMTQYLESALPYELGQVVVPLAVGRIDIDAGVSTSAKPCSVNQARTAAVTAPRATR